MKRIGIALLIVVIICDVWVALTPPDPTTDPLVQAFHGELGIAFLLIAAFFWVLSWALPYIFALWNLPTHTENQHSNRSNKE